tara:strand:- start:890 stop:1330 length:441 start_codon:yes stop_codon:yes gene_type:complete
MKKLLFFAITIALPIIAYAELKPLDEILLENSSNERFVASYSSKRCAAIYLEVGKIVQEIEPQTMTVLAEKASELTLFASLIDSGKTLDEIAMSDVNKADKEIKVIWDVLAEASDISYAKTGVYLTPHIKDMKLCRATYPLEESLF